MIATRIGIHRRSESSCISAQSTCVFLVDDDVNVLRALKRLISLEGLRVQPFASARQFLTEADHDIPGCLIVDYLMPAMNGLDLLRHMSASGLARPTIFISGRADIAASVTAMKAGAADFLVKPVDSALLIAAVRSAVRLDSARRQIASRRAEASTLFATLTEREVQVLDRVLCGRLNKQIAADLGIVEKTVKVHRARIYDKLGLRSVAEIVRFADLAGHAAGPEGQAAHADF